MQKYKDISGCVHEIDPEFEHLLPPHSVRITDEEAHAILNPPPTLDQLANDARAKRDSLLAACDWTQLPDVPESTSSQWTGYRQSLRDIPEQSGFPDAINWPEAPA